MTAEVIAVILLYGMVARWITADIYLLIQRYGKRRQSPVEPPASVQAPELPINAFNARAKEYKR